MASWNCQTLQIAWFFQGDTVDTEAVFRKAVGLEPTNSQRGVLPPPQTGRFSVAAADHGLYQLKIQSQQNRCDIFVASTPIPSALPFLPDEAIGFIFEMAKGITRELPSASRLGVVATFLSATGSSQEAIALVAQKASLSAKPKDWLDISVRLNARKNIGTSTQVIQVNRVLDFANVTFQQVFTPVGSSLNVAMLNPEDGVNCAQLGVDLNSLPETPIVGGITDPILEAFRDELLSLATFDSLEAIA